MSLLERIFGRKQETERQAGGNAASDEFRALSRDLQETEADERRARKKEIPGRRQKQRAARNQRRKDRRRRGW